MTSLDTPPAPSSAASASELERQMERLRTVYASGRTKTRAWRLGQLAGIERLLDEREGEIAAALELDLGRNRAEAWLGDIASTKGEAAYARKHLSSWMKRKKQRIPLAQM